MISSLNLIIDSIHWQFKIVINIELHLRRFTLASLVDNVGNIFFYL